MARGSCYPRLQNCFEHALLDMFGFDLDRFGLISQPRCLRGEWPS
jgi:hypothetical protein